MGLMDTIRERLLGWLLPEEWMDTATRSRMERYSLNYSYYQGEYRKQLRAKPLQPDDNIGLNFTGLVVDRSVSMLLGNGVEFDLGENEAAEEYLDTVWDANKQNILLHKCAQFAGIYGTGYLKIIPEGTEVRSSTDNQMVPRLVAIDPYWVRIETAPEDIDKVMAYVLRYNVVKDGREVARMERIERVENEAGETTNWMITNQETNRSGQWQIIDIQDWPYEFAPIVHWQNLPQPADVYGQSDIEDIIELQDRINFIASNISKIIRYHAHPMRWGINIGQREMMSMGVDEIVSFSSPDAKINNLEMSSDLASSRQYLMELRQALFDISRTVDITSVADKLGSLTNFGLHVLFMDALNKIGTKQQLFGEAIVEVNHRLLVMAGIEHEDAGDVSWSDPLPSDDAAEITAIEKDLSLGLVSKKTAALERGYDWEQEQELIKEEKSGEENLGSMLLNAFNKGQ